MIQFANWYFLLLLPLVFVWLFRKPKKSALKFSNVKVLKESGLKPTIKHKLGKAAQALSFLLLLVALARPQIPLEKQPTEEKGIDIVTLLDVSGSMQSVDFEPNRLEVARKTIADFVDQRVGDRLSFVVFAGTAYTRVPLTLDHQILQQSIKDVTTESVGEDGTAIGMAISVGVNRLKKSDAASKVMILVTDGENNAGSVDPTTAAEIAQKLGIKIYTIGVGTDKTIIPYEAFGQTQYQEYTGGLDEALLQEIAKTTGGQYYRAKDEQALENIFQEIDGLEKTSFKQDNFTHYKELAFGFMPVALVLWLLGSYWKHYKYIQIP